MATTARSLPNHYDVLGLSPGASQDEISRAFAIGMSRFGALPLAAAARIGIAFEVLRDPARRRAYDREMGLAQPEPQPRPAPIRGRMAFVSSEYGGAAAIEATPQARADTAAEPRVASFIARSLRDIAKPAEARPEPEPVRPGLRKVDAELERHVETLLAAHQAEMDGDGEADMPAPWKRPVLAIGGFVLAAAIAGALGGMWVRGEPQDAAPQLTVRLPAARPHQDIAASAPVALPTPPEAQPRRAARAEFAAVRTQRPVAPELAAAAAAPQQPDDTQAAANPPAQDQAADTAGDQSAAEAPVTQPVAASLPLPKKVVARTIERIGYSCGEVASASAIEGAPGTFKVTCSSGQSYQASPARGRYHFRRLGAR